MSNTFDDSFPYIPDDSVFRIYPISSPFKEMEVNNPQLSFGISNYIHRSGQQWIGKIGEPMGPLKRDLEVIQTRNKFTMNCDTIRTKVAADLYSYLSKGNQKFVCPETCLSVQNVFNKTSENNPLTIYYSKLKGIKRALRLMTKSFDDYHELSRAKTSNESNQLLSVVDYIKAYHRPPEKILTPDNRLIPFLGVIELLAAIKLLADNEGFGDNGENIGFVWVRDQDGNITAAQVVKANSSSAFQFLEENDSLTKFGLNASDHLHINRLKSIQLSQGNQPLIIEWEALTSDEQKFFLESLHEMAQQLFTCNGTCLLDSLFHRFDSNNNTKNNLFLHSTSKHLMEQMKIWWEYQNKLYFSEENFLTSCVLNYLNTLNFNKKAVSNSLKKVCHIDIPYHKPKKNSTIYSPPTLNWVDKLGQRWKGIIETPIYGINGSGFQSRTQFLKGLKNENLKIVRKKIFFDIYKFLSEKKFLTPEACLLNKKIKTLTSNKITQIEDTGEPHQLMFKAINHFQLGKAVVCQEKPRFFYEYIEENKKFPETIRVSQDKWVPIEGFIELVAASVILNDTDILGYGIFQPHLENDDIFDSSMGFTWIRDKRGNIIAARAVKNISKIPSRLPGFELMQETLNKHIFKNVSLLPWMRHTLPTQKEINTKFPSVIQMCRDIHLSQELSIPFDSLPKKQQETFCQSLQRMINKLNSENTLMSLCYQQSNFIRPETPWNKNQAKRLCDEIRKQIKYIEALYLQPLSNLQNKLCINTLKSLRKTIEFSLPSNMYVDEDASFTPYAPKKEGSSIGTIYKKNDNLWIGKIGMQSPLFVNNELSRRSRTVGEMNISSILEKIANDLFSLFSQAVMHAKSKTFEQTQNLTFFVIPETILSRQKMIDTFQSHGLARHFSEDQKINETLRVMSKFIEGYYDLHTISTADQSEILSIKKFIKKYHRPPETVLAPNGQSVPLLGMMELLAAIRILCDFDGFGGGLKNVGYVWEKDQSGSIIGAQIVKIDPGMAFGFMDKSVSNIQEIMHAKDEDLHTNKRYKDIQVASMNLALTIQWDCLLETQKLHFYHAIRIMIKLLTDSKNSIFNYFYRKGNYKHNAIEQITKKQAKRLEVKMKKWIDCQGRIYHLDKPFEFKNPRERMRKISFTEELTKILFNGDFSIFFNDRYSVENVKEWAQNEGYLTFLKMKLKKNN